MGWRGSGCPGDSRAAGRNAGYMVIFAFQAIDDYFPSVKFYVSVISRDLFVPQIFSLAETTFQTYACTGVCTQHTQASRHISLSSHRVGEEVDSVEVEIEVRGHLEQNGCGAVRGQSPESLLYPRCSHGHLGC